MNILPQWIYFTPKCSQTESKKGVYAGAKIKDRFRSRGVDAECKYLTGSESRYWLILVSSGFNLSCTLKSPGDLNKVLIPGLHPHRLWFNWFGTRLSCLPNLGLGTPMEMNPLWIWVHSQNCMRKWGRVRRCKKREYFHDQTTTKTI